MEEWYGYLMLRGREGAAGFLRGQGERALLSARNQRPNTEYRWFSGDRQPQAFFSSAQGTVLQMVQAGPDGFLACGDQVVLWPDGEDQAIFFFRAQERLKKEREEKCEPGDTAPETPISLPAAEPAAEIMPDTTESPPAQTDAPLPPPRPSRGAEAAFALPPLAWPGEIASWKPFFEKGAPFAPFDAPIWRYVKAPAPAPGVAFCGLGVHIQGQGIRSAAYLVPGDAAHAPAFLPGARFERGRDGAGYWVVRKAFR